MREWYVRIQWITAMYVAKKISGILLIEFVPTIISENSKFVFFFASQCGFPLGIEGRRS